MLKNLKYWAGLFDADGSFDSWPAVREDGSYYVNINATLYQKDLRPLLLLAKVYDLKVTPSKGCSYVRLHGSKAYAFMQEIKNHLVIKRAVVEYLLEQRGRTLESKEDLENFRQIVKDKRKEASPAKPFPSRKWMAGYIDGDGCLHSTFRKADGNLEFKLAVVSHKTQRAGLDLMHKQFGGYITEQCDVLKWNLSLSISKGKQVLNYFGNHLLMKKDQASLVLGLLNSRKHLRKEGASWEGNLELHKKLQELKTPATTESEALKLLSDVTV